MARSTVTARWWSGLILGVCLWLLPGQATATPLPPSEPAKLTVVEDAPLLVSVPSGVVGAVPTMLPLAPKTAPRGEAGAAKQKPTAFVRRSFYRNYRGMAAQSLLAPVVPGPAQQLPEPATPLLFAVGLLYLARLRR